VEKQDYPNMYFLISYIQ